MRTTNRVASLAGTLTLVAIATGCSRVDTAPDEQAARFADRVLPGAVDDALEDIDAVSPDARGAAAEAWLRAEDPDLRESHPARWHVISREGTRVRVDVYGYWESGEVLAPDAGKSAWGVACRTYDVSSTTTVTALACPEGTPSEP